MRERTILLVYCYCLLILTADYYWTTTTTITSEAFCLLPHRMAHSTTTTTTATCFVATVSSSRHSNHHHHHGNHKLPYRPTIGLQMSSSSSSKSSSSSDGESSSNGNSNQKNNPTTFREAEVLGLKLMQEGEYEQALTTFQNGLKLPGSRSDVVRTKRLSGPSPVGGSTGGYESQNIQTLDEFELQAANYNMACALAQLNRPQEAVQALQKALENGFDNYATVRSDPDLEPLQGLSEFESLMEDYEPKRGTSGGGFNPFGLFGKK